MKENKSVVLLNAVVSNCRLCFASKSEKRNTWGFTRNCHPEFISGSLVIIQNKEEMLKQVQHDNRRGFTLIELLVVVLIIGILAAVAVPQYQKAVWKSRFIQAKTMAESLSDAMEVYYLGNGAYTADLYALDVQLDATPRTACNTEEKRKNASQCYWDTTWGYCVLVTSGHVGCVVTRDGKAYLLYRKYLSLSTAYKGKAYCFAESFYKGSKPTAEDLNYQICAAETGSTPSSLSPQNPSFQY